MVLAFLASNLVICINDFTAKDDRQLVLQVIYFVNKCEARSFKSEFVLK